MSDGRKPKRKPVTAEIAEARFHMFSEAADHLDQCVTEEKAELAEIPFVQAVIRRHAGHWEQKLYWLQRKAAQS